MVVAAAAAGIVVDRYAGFAITHWWLGAWIALLLWGLLWRAARNSVAGVALLVAVACLAGAWHHWSWNLFRDDELARGATLHRHPVCVEAIALTGPRLVRAPPVEPMRAIPQGDQTRLTVRIVRGRHLDAWRPASGTTSLLIEGHLLGVRAGDRLKIFGRFARPEPQQNPGEFDFAAHNRADRKLCLLQCNYPDCVSVAAAGSRWNWRRWLDVVRDSASGLLAQRLDESQSPMASAILVGARERFDRQQTQAFFKTGTIHLFAISGLHVGILAGALFAIARCGLLPRRGALALVMTLTVGYCLLTDARPPVVRATILVVIACLAWMSLRRASLINTLSLAAIVVLIINPADLFRTGVQLSFLAVATLAWFQRYLLQSEPDDPLDRLIARTRPRPVKLAKAVGRYIWKLFVVSTIIWLVALPLVMYRFHLFSPIAMLLNPLIALPVTLALLSGFGVLIAGWILPLAVPPLAWLCDGCLWLTQTAVGHAADWRGSYSYVAGPPLWWVLGFYGGLGLLFALPKYRPPRRWCCALLAVWLAAAAVYPLWVRGELPLVENNNELRCTFVSVGHGSAVVLELPGGQTLLYDAGSLGSPESGARSIASQLWSRQITHIDAIVLSHADVDHYNALPGLVERFSIGAVYVSPVMFEEEFGALAALRETIDDAGLPLRMIYANDRLITNDSVEIEVLHPPEKGVIGRDNANSIVLLVEYAGRRILLPGDLEPPGLNDVLAEERLDVDLAMAPHHGSLRSSPAGFAARCTPEYVVISGGPSTDASAAIRDFQAAGAEVFHTARCGAVAIQSTGDEFTINTWR